MPPPVVSSLSLRQQRQYPGMAMESFPSGTVGSRKVSTVITIEGCFVWQRLASSHMLARSPRALISIIFNTVFRSPWAGDGRFSFDLSVRGLFLGFLAS